MARRPHLTFTRDATRLIAPTATGVQIIDVGGGAPVVELAIPDLRDVAALDDQLWTVAGQPPSLQRWSLTGAPLGAAVALPVGTSLRPLCGAGLVAAWTGAPTTLLALEGDAVVQTAIPGDSDLVLPVSPTRWVQCKRDRVSVGDGRIQRWSTTVGDGGGRILDGAILFDRRCVVLLVEQPPQTTGEGRRQLFVLGLHQPVLHHRMTLAGVEQVRFAPARGFALLYAPRRLLLVDLRFGRVVKELHIEYDIDDLAIDESAQQLALRAGDELLPMSVHDLLGAPSARAATDDALAAEPAPTAVVESPLPRPPPAAPPTPGRPFHVGHAPLGAVAALAPRPQFARTSRAEAMQLLEQHGDVVRAHVGRAIALAWDQGRLTFPAEGGLPFRLEVAGLLGRNAGLARTELGEADQAVAQAVAALHDDPGAARVSPLEAIAREFGLSPLARTILMVVAAPALWGEVARLYGILANDENRPVCDELLVQQVLAAVAPRHEIAAELNRDSPLLKNGLIRQGSGGRPFAALAIEPLIVRMLRGEEADADGDEIRVEPATRSFDDLFLTAKLKDEIVRAVAVAGAGPPRIQVRGRIGSGRHTLLATLAEAAGRRLGVIDASPVVRDLRNRAEGLRASLRRAHLLGLLPCLVGLEAIGSEDQVARDTVREILRGEPGPVALILPWDATTLLGAGHVAIDLPVLSIEQRLAVWEAMLAEAGLELREPSELAIRYSVGPGVIASVCAEVAHARRERGGDDTRDVSLDLDAAIRQHLENRLNATATRITRLATWSRVVLPPEIHDSLLELLARIKHRRTVYETWGFDSVMSTSRGVTAMFQGGPGTGKTLVASAIANELGMDLYRVDLSRIMSKWIGETEQNLAKLFDAAEDGHAIILFDEADSLFGKRTEVRTSVDRYANLEVNFLLQRIDSFEGIAILTTNFGTAIDPAFKRRLSFRLTFPFPDEEMRETLWKAHLPVDVPTAGSFDFASLARRYRLSGGYIRNAALRAAFLAAEEQTPLTQNHLERAIRAEFREIGKLADSGVLE